MKTMIAFVLSAVMALFPVSYAGQTNSGNSFGVQIPNPITEYSSMEEAAAAAGFDMTVPEAIDGCTERVIQVFNADTNDAMFEVIYRDGGEEPENVIHIRKAPGTEDISGDYNQYAEHSTETVGDVEVTMKGSDGQVHLATWTKDGYTYSIAVYTETGISGDDMAELVAGVR